MGVCGSPSEGHFYLGICIGLIRHPLRNYVHDSGLAVGNVTRVWVGPCRERGLCIVKLEFVKQETHPMEQVTWAEEPQQIPAPDKAKLRRLLLSLLSWETKPLDVSPPLPNVR